MYVHIHVFVCIYIYNSAMGAWYFRQLEVNSLPLTHTPLPLTLIFNPYLLISMHIYLYIYMYTHIFRHTYIHIYICIYMCIHICEYDYDINTYLIHTGVNNPGPGPVAGTDPNNLILDPGPNINTVA
jgi:hypothetical protein